MTAAKELMNFEARLSDNVTELIDTGRVFRPEHFFEQRASMIAFLHPFVLFVPSCG
jgi:hypothetical protein